MSTSRASATSPHDAALPALAQLLPAEAAQAPAGAWLRERGGTLRELRAAQALYRPGRSISVVYAATVAWDGGQATRERLVAVADREPMAAAAAGGGVPPGRPRWWLYPEDPQLPGLARLADAGFARSLAQRARLPDVPLELRDRAYRPRTRAVVELAGAGATIVVGGARASVRARVYVKALRPGRAAAVRDRLAVLAPLAPVPACRLCEDELGLLVLEGRRGRTLHDVLRDGGAVPGPEALLDLLERIGRATPLAAAPPASTAADRARRHGRLLRAILPAQAARVDRLVAALATALEEETGPPDAIAHNDFHPSQLIVDDAGAIRAVVDVDDVGPGWRADDLAAMAGRAWTSAVASDGEAAARFAAYAERLCALFATVVDPRDLCRRVAVVALGRATGPFRIQQRDWPQAALRRVEAAERWLAAAADGVPPQARR